MVELPEVTALKDKYIKKFNPDMLEFACDSDDKCSPMIGIIEKRHIEYHQSDAKLMTDNEKQLYASFVKYCNDIIDAAAYDYDVGALFDTFNIMWNEGHYNADALIQYYSALRPHFHAQFSIVRYAHTLYLQHAAMLLPYKAEWSDLNANKWWSVLGNNPALRLFFQRDILTGVSLPHTTLPQSNIDTFVTTHKSKSLDYLERIDPVASAHITPIKNYKHHYDDTRALINDHVALIATTEPSISEMKYPIDAPLPPRIDAAVKLWIHEDKRALFAQLFAKKSQDFHQWFDDEPTLHLFTWCYITNVNRCAMTREFFQYMSLKTADILPPFKDTPAYNYLNSYLDKPLLDNPSMAKVVMDSTKDAIAAAPQKAIDIATKGVEIGSNIVGMVAYTTKEAWDNKGDIVPNWQYMLCQVFQICDIRGTVMAYLKKFLRYLLYTIVFINFAVFIAKKVLDNVTMQESKYVSVQYMAFFAWSLLVLYYNSVLIALPTAIAFQLVT